MSKFLIQGKDAGECLNRLSTANVNGDKDKMTYTQWLDNKGKMQADLTITKLDDDKFFIVVTGIYHFY
jgi:4-methylaminobutanoate oxidase (formaldehyde-forming)